MQSFIKLAAGILLYPLYILGYLIPRSKNIWVFGAWFGNKYSDNSRYIFEYVNKNHIEIKSIWLSKDFSLIRELIQLGYIAHHQWSIIGIWYAFRAGYTFICCSYNDVNRVAITNSIKVQLWHGIPMKKIRYDDPNNPTLESSSFLSKLFFSIFPFYHEEFDYVISTGPICTDRFKTAFKINRKQILETGYPRTDNFYFKNDIKNKLLIHADENTKRVLYAPTHRLEGKGDFEFLNGFDENAWNRLASKHNLELFICLHFFEKEKSIIYMEQFKSSESIHFFDLGRDNDINLYLNKFDVLITDYSSIWYDYLLLNRPIIYFAPDLEKYLINDREHYNNYSDEVAGNITRSWNETLGEIIKIFSGEDNWDKRRLEKIEKYYSFQNGQSSKKLTEFLLNND